MSIRRENGTVVGNVEDKSNLNNPISRALVSGFDESFLRYLKIAQPKSVHEVGCGEGRRLAFVLERYPRIAVRGTDLSSDTLQIAKDALGDQDGLTLVQKPVEALAEPEDHADLIICCEVLEHVPDPQAALSKLRQLNARLYLLSVPREPIWRLLNMARFKYWAALGNTPGHLNHWSSKGFQKWLEAGGFERVACSRPLPWTMVLCRPIAS